MRTITAIVCFSAFIGLSVCQFPNGRILEPPVPALCAQRQIHERTPDGKGYIYINTAIFVFLLSKRLT